MLAPKVMNNVFGAFKLLQLTSEIVSKPASVRLKVINQFADTKAGPASMLQL